MVGGGAAVEFNGSLVLWKRERSRELASAVATARPIVYVINGRSAHRAVSAHAAFEAGRHGASTSEHGRRGPRQQHATS